MRLPTMWYVRPAKPQISLEHHLQFLSLNGGCAVLSKSTLVNMPHCWKSHVTAHKIFFTKAGIRWNFGVLLLLLPVYQTIYIEY